MKIRIVTPDGNSFLKELKDNTTPMEEASKLSLQYEALSCRIDHCNERLDTLIDRDCTLELLDLRDNYANMSYQASLTFLYIRAVHKVLGADAHVLIANSLSKGLFTTVKAPFDDADVKSIETEMHALVQKNLPFDERHYDRKEMISYLKENGRGKRLRLLQSTDSIDEAKICTFDGEEDIFYLHLLPSSGFLKWFELRRYRNGILLRFPHQSKPDELPVYEEQKLLYEAFSEETHWEHLMNVDFAADLNEAVSGNYQDLIMLSEALHEMKVASIAKEIQQSKKRIILIAGPSSSGKTSFAKRLCIQMRVLGMKPLYLGTDDYFVDRSDLERDENGKADYEALSAVDVPLFEKQMNDLLQEKKVDIPVFDFIEGKKIFGTRITSISSAHPIVIEGIHALNPQMTKEIDERNKFRIYISPLTSLNIDAHHRIPTTDARMLRRLVRDNRTRGRSAEMTILDWKNVRAGEEKWIFPYNSEADVLFNSSCIYELSVLKKYAAPLLCEIPQSSSAYPEAQRMLDFLKFFKEVPDDSCIVNNSILREFIGGSILVG